MDWIGLRLNTVTTTTASTCIYIKDSSKTVVAVQFPLVQVVNQFSTCILWSAVNPMLKICYFGIADPFQLVGRKTGSNQAVGPGPACLSSRQ
jgi:hypothetical protein